jgi:selenocysteine lyase/cysteine desulfurase
MTELEMYFLRFRGNTIGYSQEYDSCNGRQKIVYADWIASGRMYLPIERILQVKIGPFVANTHTETSETGTLMTKAYRYAHRVIKEHVNAGPGDVILTTGSGMTSVIVKFQRILGLKVCGDLAGSGCLKENDKPVVFISHMEHHSNHTSWYETFSDVVLLKPGKDLLVDLNDLEENLKRYASRKIKIGSFTACSNVTGIETPVHEIARLVHRYGGVCFIDYAASAPYVKIDMHPPDPLEKLDAIFFSPHKFLGGPGASGVLIFDSTLYNSKVPDQPGGGTVYWTNPWGEYRFIDDIEIREDGGTPGFLQAMKAALAIRLKEQMTVEKIRQREEQLVARAFQELSRVPRLHILADSVKVRLPVFSFYIRQIHYNLVVKLLSDRFGIQMRGGCACAGTYGHFLLDVSYEKSKEITDRINIGDLSGKPGWIRMSLHPTTTDDELTYIAGALREISINHHKWGKDYIYNRQTNEFRHKDAIPDETVKVMTWFDLE